MLVDAVFTEHAHKGCWNFHLSKNVLTCKFKRTAQLAVVILMMHVYTNVS